MMRAMTKKARRRWFLREYREARKWTQEELAEASGVPRSRISELEKGSERYNQDVLEALAKALSTPEELVTPGDLLDRDPTLPAPLGFWRRKLDRLPAAERDRVERVVQGVMENLVPDFEGQPPPATSPKRTKKKA